MCSASRASGIEILHMLVWGTACAFAAAVEPRFWYSVATFYVAFILACRWPERRWDLMSASTALLVYASSRRGGDRSKIGRASSSAFMRSAARASSCGETNPSAI